MRRLLLALVGLVAFGLPPSAVAQVQVATYETLTVSTSAVGLDTATIQGIAYCQARLETDKVRFRIDGTNPTAAVGVELSVGDILQIFDANSARRLRLIRSTGSVDATMQVTCWRPSPYPAYAGYAITTAGSSGGSGGGDGTIIDGVSASVKASVLDYTESNPLAVRLTDTDGNYVGAGAGTQYAEDSAAAANPTGTALNLIRADTLAALTSDDGDNVAARGTDKGELYVKHVDTLAVSGPLTDVQLRASAVPISASSLPLPTGAATEATLSTLNGKVTAVNTGAVTISVFPDNEPFNFAQVAGTTVSTGNGTVDAGTIRVNLTSNGTGVIGVTSATASNFNAQVIGPVAHDAAATAVNPVIIGGLASSSAPANVSANDASRIWTSLFGAVNVIMRDTSGNAVTGSGIAQQDETAFTPGTTSFTPIGGQVDDTATDGLDEGEAGAARLTPSRALHVSLFDTSGNALTAATDATHDSAAGTAGPQIMLEFDDTSPDAIDEGDAGRLRGSANRNLYTTLRDAAGNERGLNIDANGRIGVTGSGTFAVQVDGAALTALQLLDDSIFADDVGFTAGTSKVMGVGFVADEASVDSVNEDDIGAPRMTLDRLAYAAVGATASRAQSALECPIVSAATTNATNCKASAGNLYGFDLINTTSTLYYLRLYNTSGSPTCSSATGFIRSIPIPSFNATDGDGAGIVRIAPVPVGYDTGISFCLTAGASSTDNNAAATGIYGALLYK